MIDHLLKLRDRLNIRLESPLKIRIGFCKPRLKLYCLDFGGGELGHGTRIEWLGVMVRFTGISV